MRSNQVSAIVAVRQRTESSLNRAVGESEVET